ncbi:zinc ribbon domain-containing protein [Ferrovum sp. PN-J185]|uniref:FmdB family zinc ribbon protein n=1 Tax=Ferrovum sp. PN-J185 TaxID=1356306 RepID=UPI000796D8A2|nr:zinc ribbon domain-containing protein [Ferrovum sp. PN-J185]KXW56939.1 zinc ribbon domain protein [Ferrovum sp. PN-J185]MCC6069188.1 zinc ribbon domain-containing protein [Ferrovum sp. PN-J185]MDE1892349.1 zinc ribbon domain-containing protein [Betaproteobacteria bacterium]
MPTYDFDCPKCGSFDLILKINDRDADQFCPICGEKSVRNIIQAPQFSFMTTDKRTAYEINEKASHEPKLRSHGSNCSCCGSGKQSKNPKSFINKRPWMISH